MSTIGIKLEADTLVLTRGRDFKWTFENLDDAGELVDYPAGQLYFEFPKLLTADVPKKWTFTISGATATLKVESAEANTVPARAVWHLVFLATGESAGGDPVAIGVVQVQGA